MDYKSFESLGLVWLVVVLMVKNKKELRCIREDYLSMRRNMIMKL